MMCKMAKKGMLGAALTAGALFLVFGTSAPSYVKTAFHSVRDNAKDSVPIQFEIERARQQVNDLEPAIHQNIENLARAEVDVEHLKREIETTTANLQREERAIVALREGLVSGKLQLTGGGQTYTADEVKNDLARRLDYYRQVKRILNEKQETLKLREKSVLAAREQLAQMAGQKRALMVKIEGIQARLDQIKATQAANEFTFDSSALAQAKQTVNELERRLDVKQRVAEQEGRYIDKGLPLVIEPERDVLKEVDEEFGRPSAPTDKSL